MKHAEIECPVCEKLKKDCKKVYYDEWHDEYVCKKCGLVIKHFKKYFIICYCTISFALSLFDNLKIIFLSVYYSLFIYYYS